MSAKTSAQVIIGKKIITISGYESEEYLQRVASYINSKINEIEGMEKFRRLPAEMKNILIEVNIADDYFKAKDQAQKLEWDAKEREKEIYDLKHELISVQIREESMQETVARLEKENRELLLAKSKLDTALADALAGRGKAPAAEEGKPAQDKADGNHAEGGEAQA